MTQWQWAMGKLNAHAAAKYSPRLSSAFSFQLTADDRRTADWLPPQLGSVHLLLQGSSAVAVACLAGSAVKSIAAVTVGTALPTLLGGGEEGGRGGRGKKNKKTLEGKKEEGEGGREGAEKNEKRKHEESFASK